MLDIPNTLTDEMILEEMHGDNVDVSAYKEAFKEITDYKNEDCDSKSSKTK